MEEENLNPRILLQIKGGKPFIDQENFDKWFRTNFKEVNEILRNYPQAKITKVLDDKTISKVQQLIIRARERKKNNYQISDFANQIAIDINQEKGARSLIKEIQELEYVEKAFFEWIPTTPVRATPEIDPPKLEQPNKEQQGTLLPNLGSARSGVTNYFDQAPIGVGSFETEHILGANGDNIAIIDIEQGWIFNHTNIISTAITLKDGINETAKDHGLAVLGIIKADGFAPGRKGMAPAMSCKAMSVWFPQLNGPNVRILHKAILCAAIDLKIGDILLIEQQVKNITLGVEKNDLPVEVDDFAFDAIRLSVDAGVVVIECAGNGHHDLDDFSDDMGQTILNKNNNTFRNSGAIMVGAATSDVSHKRLFIPPFIVGFPPSGSNYGSRIDCYAWGENIRTLGPFATTFRADFGGTSGAGAIIAGVVGIIQGIAFQEQGFLFTPEEMRDLLSDETLGTSSNNPVVDRIGAMPNLTAILDTALGIIV